MPQLPNHVVVLALQQHEDLIDHRHVLLAGAVPHARSDAAIDEVLQTRALDHRLGAFRCVWDGEVARPVGKELFQYGKRVVEALAIREGAEVRCAILPRLPHFEHARVRLLKRDADIGVLLIVPQADVVLGAPLLDEVVLEDQGLDLGIGDDRLELGRGLQHGQNFGRLLFG